jgi:hypothetical protein
MVDGRLGGSFQSEQLDQMRVCRPQEGPANWVSDSFTDGGLIAVRAQQDWRLLSV